MSLRILVVLILCAALSMPGISQTSDAPNAVSLTLGKSAYRGDLGNGIFNFKQPFYPFLGVRGIRYINSSWDASVGFTIGKHGFKGDSTKFSETMFHFSALAHYKVTNDIILPSNLIVQPFVSGGLGFARYSANGGDPSSSLTIPIGLGAKAQIQDGWGLFWQSNYGFNFSDDHDGDNTDNDNDHHMNHELGVLYTFGYFPDRDGDGISDSKDKCPDIPGSRRLQGCPDRDGDGIRDSQDDCPDEPGSRLNNGCPDTDKDGVINSMDDCPTIPGPSDNNGCPEVEKSEKIVFENALRGIHFETAKSVIKPESYGILDQIVEIMKNKPFYKLKIEGHTDSDGTDEFNQKLSEDRAAAVKAYLVKYGVKKDRLRTKGYGESRPVADNESDEGKRLNRRVDFIVVYK